MLSYLVRRVLMLVPVFLAVSVVVFSILHFIPGDPIDNLLKIGSSPAARAEMEARYGLDKPLVAPVFAGDRVKAMVVASLAVALPEAEAAEVEAAAPRLRDAFLKVMFAHANSGGFDGAFTEGRKMEDLRAALLKAGRGVLGDQVSDVLITEIARQDM